MSSYRLKLQHMRYPLRLGETLLGRSPYCSIVLSGSQVSRQHAAIRVTRDGVQLEDLGSRNGTWVNRRRLSETCALVPGDTIDVGGHLMEIELETRDDRPQRESLAVTGEYPAPADADDGSDDLTQPGYIPGEHPAPKR
jgi:pSer/pThr/pTyr-binding forkhead associated (FHA) protein